MVTSLGEEGAGLVLLAHLFVCCVRVSFCHLSLPLDAGGLAAVCDCGTPWTFLLTFLSKLAPRLNTRWTYYALLLSNACSDFSSFVNCPIAFRQTCTMTVQAMVLCPNTLISVNVECLKPLNINNSLDKIWEPCTRSKFMFLLHVNFDNEKV